MGIEGVVEEVLPRGLYSVRCDGCRRVVAALSTQARRVLVKVLPGDRVLLDISLHDPNRGRINARIS